MATNNYAAKTVNIFVDTGGALGTAKFSTSCADIGGTLVKSTTPGPFVWVLPYDGSGPRHAVSFPAGTYVTGDIYTWNPGDSVVNHSGTGTPVPTITSQGSRVPVGQGPNRPDFDYNWP